MSYDSSLDFHGLLSKLGSIECNIPEKLAMSQTMKYEADTVCTRSDKNLSI